MERNEERVNKLKNGFDKAEREISRKSILNSSVDDEAMRFMLKVCNNAQKWVKQLEDKMYVIKGSLSASVYKTSEPVSLDEAKKHSFAPVAEGDIWSDTAFDCGWFHIEGDIPSGENSVCLIDISGEGLVIANDGSYVKGITTYASEFSYEYGLPVKKVIPINDKITKNGKIDFYIDGACNDLQGNLCNSGCVMLLKTALCNEAARTAKYDMEVLTSLFNALSEKDAEYRLDIAKAIYNAHFLADKNDFTGAHLEMEKILSKQSNTDFDITAHGHGHLDLAWLWPIRETKRKAARTMASQLDYIENNPDYVFGASQAHMFLWLKENHPQLYSRIKEKIKSKNISIQGCAWVESDVNIPCGESLIRQMLYGKKFFKQEFDIENDVLWLPDTFGYSGSLPQIIKKCGIEYFITQKLSWNTVNEFPYQTFNWKGIDGSEVLAHLLPANTYNGPLTPEEMLRVQNTYKEKAVSSSAMMAYGVGDGGGGPSLDHIERFKRVKNLKGLPKINTKTTYEFMSKLAENRETYPSYQGELYLERHRGTYTTQAANKKYNRLCEKLLRRCEFLYSAAEKMGLIEYPSERLEKLWKEVLLYQFHDILPGSSIDRVYKETGERYPVIVSELERLIDEACKVLEKHYNSELYFNDLPWESRGVAPMGVSSSAVQAEESVSAGNVLENSFLKVVFANNGEIASVYNKQLGEYIKTKGNLNSFKLYKDSGDCWDILPVEYYAAEPKNLKCTVFKNENGTVFIEKKIGSSAIQQSITLNDDIIVFDTFADWQEKHKMLRVDFPLDIKNDFASYQSQYGHINRPTTHHDSKSRAMFEVCAHKWCDLSDGEYGVSILNDCKYGYRIWDSKISINLLRAPSYPGKTADIGTHCFKYALYFHKNDVENASVYEKAYRFNSEIFGKGSGSSYICESFISSDNDKIIIDWIKKSEDGKGYAVRILNSSEKPQKCSISSDLFEISAEIDFKEDIIKVSNGKNITLTPFEVKAFYLK